jgi:hypothetical protein
MERGQRYRFENQHIEFGRKQSAVRFRIIYSSRESTPSAD